MKCTASLRIERLNFCLSPFNLLTGYLFICSIAFGFVFPSDARKRIDCDPLDVFRDKSPTGTSDIDTSPATGGGRLVGRHV